MGGVWVSAEVAIDRVKFEKWTLQDPARLQNQLVQLVQLASRWGRAWGRVQFRLAANDKSHMPGVSFGGTIVL